MEENINKLMETNKPEVALKLLIYKEKERHSMIVDETSRVRHRNYLMGLETAYDVICNTVSEGIKL